MTRNYAGFRAELGRFESVVRSELDGAGTPPGQRLGALNLARQCYGVMRRRPRAEWPQALGRVARSYDSMPPERVRLVLRAALVARDAAELESTVVKEYEAVKNETKTRPKPRALVRRRSGVLARMQDEPSAVEVVAEMYAARHLKAALAVYPPVVRQCVIGRLARRLSFAALARELRVAPADVAEMLATVRSRVNTFTTFFASDWYWQESN
jgi:hypothetical protein